MPKSAEEADVCVVGAGYAGLAAARELARHGRSVLVLEARDRVGGRIWTQRVADGTPVDRGGAWLGPGHDTMFSLAREFGVPTYKTWVAGSHLLAGDGRIRRYKGLIPKISPLAVATIALAQLRIDVLARQVPLEAPWTARRAAHWDARTVASWLAHSGIRTTVGRDLFEMAVRGLFAADLADVSLLDLLFLVRAHRTTSVLFSIDGGAQENLVDGGAGTMAEKIAQELGDSIRLSTPVRAITQVEGRVVVRSDNLNVTSTHVIVAVPPVLALEISFVPSLPDDRRALYRTAVAGHETKTLVVFEEPFWRSRELSGQSAGPGSAAEVTIDASPPDASRGVLASFTFGRVAERLEQLPADQRRRAVIDALVGRFGPLAAAPIDFVETAWWNESWTCGCTMAHFPPGALTRHGHLLREPFGRIHWAGTETATAWHGSMEGAVRSGIRAAKEILIEGAATAGPNRPALG